MEAKALKSIIAMRFRRYASSIGLLVLAVLCGSCGSDSKYAGLPNLVVVVVVDQMRGDYLGQFDPHWEGAFRTMLDSGAVFSNFHHDYSATESVVGHGTLLSGRYPMHHGFISTEWIDRETFAETFVTGDPDHTQLDGGPGRSPARFIGTSLADWVQQDNPKAKVFAIGGKERSVVGMAGIQTSDAYWYSFSHGFTTSTYYRSELPEWIERVNNRQGEIDWAGFVWNPIRNLEGMAFRADDSPIEGNMFGLGRAFPHTIGGGDDDQRMTLSGTPFADELVLEMALEAVTELEMGEDDVPDLLLVTLSSLDLIGHIWGYGSHEVADQVLRVDRNLDEFFSELVDRIGFSELLFVVTGDHGVAPVIGSEESLRLNSKWVSLQPVLDSIDSELQIELGVSKLVGGTTNRSLYLDLSEVETSGIDPKLVISRFADGLRATDGIARVYTRDELMEITEPRDELERRLLNSFHPDRDGDLLWVPEEGCIPRRVWYSMGENVIAAHHGSGYDYDTHVPLLIYGPGIVPRSYDHPVSAVDLAPTLARYLGVTPMEQLDGKVIAEIFESQM
ncbi:MAG: alkaline phosphatase family protein [Myxococcota bacterium]|nr:alkaline phosphatase family protein [Myxococcota bacterium]